jgi:hypothetical protein
MAVRLSALRTGRPLAPRTIPGTQEPGYQQGCEADHSPPANAEVKKMWIYTSTHPYAFMA